MGLIRLVMLLVALAVLVPSAGAAPFAGDHDHVPLTVPLASDVAPTSSAGDLPSPVVNAAAEREPDCCTVNGLCTPCSGTCASLRMDEGMMLTRGMRVGASYGAMADAISTGAPGI